MPQVYDHRMNGSVIRYRYCVVKGLFSCCDHTFYVQTSVRAPREQLHVLPWSQRNKLGRVAHTTGLMTRCGRRVDAASQLGTCFHVHTAWLPHL